jgi:hypothetical protein
MSKCAGTKRTGEPCTHTALSGERTCYNHHPDYAAQRRASAKRAVILTHSSIGKELRESREFMWEFLEVLLSDQLPPCFQRGAAERGAAPAVLSAGRRA